MKTRQTPLFTPLSRTTMRTCWVMSISCCEFSVFTLIVLNAIEKLRPDPEVATFLSRSAPGGQGRHGKGAPDRLPRQAGLQYNGYPLVPSARMILASESPRRRELLAAVGVP